MRSISTFSLPTKRAETDLQTKRTNRHPRRTSRHVPQDARGLGIVRFSSRILVLQEQRTSSLALSHDQQRPSSHLSGQDRQGVHGSRGDVSRADPSFPLSKISLSDDFLLYSLSFQPRRLLRRNLPLRSRSSSPWIGPLLLHHRSSRTKRPLLLVYLSLPSRRNHSQLSQLSTFSHFLLLLSSSEPLRIRFLLSLTSSFDPSSRAEMLPSPPLHARHPRPRSKPSRSQPNLRLLSPPSTNSLRSLRFGIHETRRGVHRSSWKRRRRRSSRGRSGVGFVGQVGDGSEWEFREDEE